jgi:hypothetical protein
MSTSGIVLVIAMIAVVAVAILLFVRRRQRLRSRFGPEYNRAVQETGNKYRAEAKLEKLEKRVEKLSIRPLQPEAARRFHESWRGVQARFVDDPRTALGEADRLLSEVMSARGYPLHDFEERAAELSVNHARVVEHYRAGHEIALRHAKGQASTEDMRQAMIHYRTLFEDLVGETPKAQSKGAGGPR